MANEQSKLTDKYSDLLKRLFNLGFPNNVHGDYNTTVMYWLKHHNRLAKLVGLI